MSSNTCKAVSFTNTYCSLADGVESGLQECLAENVVLDWFGKTIKSKSNVAAFMNTHKVNSKHVFSKISSTSRIGYNTKPRRVRTKRRSSNASKSSSCGNISIELRSSCENTPKTPMIGTISQSDRSRSLLKNDVGNSGPEEYDLTCELRDDDLSKLFKLEKIEATNIEEIEQKISDISLEDRIKFISPRKRDFKETIDNQDDQKLSMRYVEAYGEILFSKKSLKLSGFGEKKIISSSLTHTWRKPCKLQIAYTSHEVHLQQTCASNKKNLFLENSPNSSGSQNNSDDRISCKTESDINYAENFLHNLSVEKEDYTLSRNLNEYMSKNKASQFGFVPRYVNEQLVFHTNDCDNLNNNTLMFNHVIHVIIYEGISRCRINLSQKFT